MANRAPQQAPQQAPENPNSASHVNPGAANASGGKPEAVRFMLVCWAIMIGGELLHQVLTAAALLWDPSELIANAKQARPGEAISEGLLNLAVWSSVIVMALIQLTILALFVAALSAINKQRKWAGNARRMLQIFSVFFALRALAVFAVRPTSTVIPLAFHAFDGVVQIMLAVAGVLGLIYASQKESAEWVEKGA